ncbi:TPA: hypothetical protein KUN82_003705 [Serratia marcescens]|nr:hypothetical protein [Serratia marcescens]
MDNKLSKPVAWTDAEELRDLSKHRCAYMFIIDPANPYHDPRRQQMLYSHEYVSALLQRIAGLQEVAVALREWIDAVPDEVAASLPTMPGVDRDWVDSIIGEVAQKLATPLKVGFTVKGDFCSACNERYCGNCAHANGAKVQ